MTLTYNDTDITDSVAVTKCEYDSYLSGCSDTLMVAFDDPLDRWAEWKPSVGDSVRLQEESLDTGLMYVNTLKHEKQEMVLFASPCKGELLPVYKKWAKVSFCQIADTIAKEHGWEASFYGVADQTYSGIEQGCDDLKFLQDRCALEGCDFVLHDGKLKVVSWDFMEGMETSTYLINTVPEGVYLWDMPYIGGVTLVGDGVTGKYVHDVSLSRLTINTNERYDSIAQANRFAKKAWQKENLSKKRGVIYSGSFITDIMAGTKLTVNAGYWQERTAILTHVRQDLMKRRTKIWFRLAFG